MIMPPHHARFTAARRRLSRREVWILRTVSAVLGLLVVAVAISLAVASHRSGNGCVDVALPYSTGGAEIYRCGAGARSLCASVGALGGYRANAAHVVAAQCRKAGLPVG